jgi:hypothetical protein
MLLAGCSGPVIVQTSADQHAIQFVAMGAGYISPQDIEDRARRHCATYGLSSRQIETEAFNASSRSFRFECETPRRQTVDNLGDRKLLDLAPPAPKPPAVKTVAERKQAAWDQAHAISPAWLKCLTDGAAQSAHASSEAADIAAVAVVAGCSRWERDLHEVLRKVGEDDREFGVVLHEQVVAFAADRIASARSAPVAGPEPASAPAQAAAR